jgi:4-hydroxybenzoate polyprenyltransferase
LDDTVLAKFSAYVHLMRLDKPIGIWLLFFPAGIAACMAASTPPDNRLLLILLLGAFITRSAGCIVNDMTDRKLDAQVERTRHRPLASGALSMKEAMIALFLLGLAGLALLAFLPFKVLLLGLIAVPMILAYPWMKRITWWPQCFLGLTFNMGVWMAWAATGEAFTGSTVLLYGAFLFWTLGYDTIYAIQDAEDDRKVGIKSTAMKLGRQITRFVAGWYAAMLLCLFFAGPLSGSGPAYLFALAPVALHMRWQVRELPFAKAERSAGHLFRSNQWLGLALFVGIYIDRLISF